MSCQVSESLVSVIGHRVMTPKHQEWPRTQHWTILKWVMSPDLKLNDHLLNALKDACLEKESYKPGTAGAKIPVDQWRGLME